MEKKLDQYNLEYLERQLHNMSKLVEINSIINSTLDIGKLLTIIMEIIKDIMEAEASTLLLYEDDSEELVFKVALGDAGRELQEKYRVRIGQGIAGWVAENRKALYINDVYSDNRFDPDFDKQTGFKTKSILCSPLLFKGKLLGVIQAINTLNKPGFDDEDIVLFRAFSNQAVLAVQNAIFFQNALEEERIKNEIKSARSIQDSLLPEVDERFGKIQIAARSVSAREVGGEFYDISYQDDSIRFALGDIHTKGIPGAMHASMVSGAVKALSGVRSNSPAFLMKNISSTLVKSVSTIDRLSLFYGTVNSNGEMIKFINAGFAYPILIRDGVSRYIKFGGRSLGDGEIKAKIVNIKLKKGDSFVVITDGIVNLKNRNGQQIGLKRVMDFLGTDFDNADNIVNSLLGFAEDFTDGLVLREDFSIIAIRVE